MNEALLKMSALDRMRMERIVMDRDGEDAIALVKQWLEIVARAGHNGISVAFGRRSAAITQRERGYVRHRTPLFFAHCGKIPSDERLTRNLRDGGEMVTIRWIVHCIGCGYLTGSESPRSGRQIHLLPIAFTKAGSGYGAGYSLCPRLKH